MQCWSNIGSAFFRDDCDQVEYKDGVYELGTENGLLS
jgi:hypothetical protein